MDSSLRAGGGGHSDRSRGGNQTRVVRRFGLGTFLIEHDCFTASLVMGCTLHYRARTSKQNL